MGLDVRSPGLSGPVGFDGSRVTLSTLSSLCCARKMTIFTPRAGTEGHTVFQKLPALLASPALRISFLLFVAQACCHTSLRF